MSNPDKTKIPPDHGAYPDAPSPWVVRWSHLAAPGAGVSVTTAYPGVVLTNIRSHGLNAAGQAAGSSGLKEDKAMGVEECAALILRGMQRREREVVMTAPGKLGRFLKLVWPAAVERMALNALKDDVKPQ